MKIIDCVEFVSEQGFDSERAYVDLLNVHIKRNKINVDDIISVERTDTPLILVGFGFDACTTVRIYYKKEIKV